MVWSLYFPFRKDLFWGICEGWSCNLFLSFNGTTGREYRHPSSHRGESESVGCPRSVLPTCFRNGEGRPRRRKGREAGGVLNTFPWIAWFEGLDAEGKDPRKLGSGSFGIERCSVQGLVFVKYYLWLKVEDAEIEVKIFPGMVCCPVSDFDMVWFAECIPLHWS